MRSWASTRLACSRGGPSGWSVSLTHVSRVLLVTNDFPPRRGGIQSYLVELVSRLAATGEHTLTVYAPQWKDADVFDAQTPGYRVVRHPGTLMLPVPTVDSRMRRLIAEGGIDTVWFGAAAPLGLLAHRARRAGASRVLASTHGHEVGWSMLPAARSVLRRIGEDSGVVTFVSRYTRGRFASAFGPRARLEHLPPGVDTERFRPDPVSRAELRARYGLGQRPTVLCLSRAVPRWSSPAGVRIWTRCAGWPSVSVSAITSRSPAVFRPPTCPLITRWPTCSPCRAGRAAPGWMSKGWASSSWKHLPLVCR